MAKNSYATTPFPASKDEGWRHLNVPIWTNPEREVKVSAIDFAYSGKESGVTVAKTRPRHNPSSTDHKFDLLHEEYVQEGYLVKVPDNITLTQPIHFAFRPNIPGTYLPDVTIAVGSNSKVSIIEEYNSNQQTLISSRTTVEVGSGSHFEFISLSKLNQKSQHYHNLTVHLDQDAKATIFNAASDSMLSRMSVNAILDGAGAEAKMLGCAITGQADQIIFDTLQRHNSKNTLSDLDYRTVLFDQSVMHFSGMIQIAKGADGSNAYQKNGNVLVSDRAKIQTSPKLEIEANDVRCTHGATSGPLDQEQLLYLKSRGLSEMQSSELLLQGSISDLIKFIENKQTAEILQKHLNSLLKRGIK